MDKKHQFNLGYALLAFVAILAIQYFLTATQTYRHVAYSEFLKLLEQRKFTEVVVRGERVEGILKAPDNGASRVIAIRVDPPLAQEFAKYDVSFRGMAQQSLLRDVLSWVLPVLLFFGLWMFVFRRIADRQGFGGLTNIGKSKAKVYVETDTGVTFDDVAGVDDAKAELEEVVQFLKDRDTYGRLGAHVPKGILLVGPPGTGKTLLAKAVAGQAGVPFFSISGSEFVEMFVGVGAARVRDLFEQARQAAPCIIFIDELDALGKARSAVGLGGGHDEKEQTLNQLLAELDGFDPREGIVLLAATNRPEVLDPALLRAGRFDRQVVVDRPDRKGRAAILRVHLKKIAEEADIDADEIAAITPGFTGADLANLVNEAAIIATRRDAAQVSISDFTAAVERIIGGIEKSGRILNPDERRRIAVHEMGHALAAANTPGADPVHKVSIIPRSIGALGYTMQRPTEDRFVLTKGDLENRMVVLMAGRAAEHIVFGDVSTGAADDLARVTDVAREIVTKFGMTEAVGQAVYERERSRFLGDQMPGMTQRDYSEATASRIDGEVTRLIDEAYQRARDLLTDNRKHLDDGTAILLDRETITPEDFPPLNQSAGDH